jgi:AcrR family transcriptional regulator
MQRLTHAERKAQTRAELLASARTVFLERGFHVATLDEIASAAGYSKGAVYSNFESKEALFLVILADHFQQRLAVFVNATATATTVEQGIRMVARGIAAADRSEPHWAALLLEFWSHASRDEALRQRVAVSREQYINAIAQSLEQLVAGHGVQFAIPTADLVRGGVALVRGMSLERRLQPGSIPDALFEQMVMAYLAGFTRRTEQTPEIEGGNHERNPRSTRVSGRGGRTRQRVPGA